jgi:hypothetical protein
VLDVLDQEATETTPVPPAYVSNGQPLGPQIDALFDLREKKRALETEAEEIGRVIATKSVVIMAELDAQGLDKVAGRKAWVGITKSIVGQVENWDLLWAYIRRQNAPELLQRRLSDGAFREHAAMRRNRTVPGVVPFEKRKLSLTVNT